MTDEDVVCGGGAGRVLGEGVAEESFGFGDAILHEPQDAKAVAGPVVAGVYLKRLAKHFFALDVIAGAGEFDANRARTLGVGGFKVCIDFEVIDRFLRAAFFCTALPSDWRLAERDYSLQS